MKRFALLLAMSAAAFGAEGFTIESDLAGLEYLKTKAKVGDVVRVVRFKVEIETTPTEKPGVVVLFYRTRHVGPELKLSVNARQWAMLEHSRECYVRKNKDTWDYLGSIMTRDPSGIYVFD